MFFVGLLFKGRALLLIFDIPLRLDSSWKTRGRLFVFVYATGYKQQNRFREERQAGAHTRAGSTASDCFTAFVFANCFRLFLGTHPLLESAERKRAGAVQVMNAWLLNDAETMGEM